MHLRTRPLIALLAAYGILLAAVFGTLSAGQLAVYRTSSVCRASDPVSDQAPVSPVRHDLDCCIGCCSGSPALPGRVAAPTAVPALTRIVWTIAAANNSHSPAEGSPSARAPPARI